MGPIRSRIPSASAVEEDIVSAKPFLKWVGGKRQLADRIVPLLLPYLSEDGCYHEPMVGGGAIFFALRNAGYTGYASLSDSNQVLLDTYVSIRDHSESVIQELSELRYDRELYYEMREHGPPGERYRNAAWMIYMNRCCFNGLWRVNKSGKFNVPFGDYDDPRILDAENLRACSLALQNTSVALFACGFETSAKRAMAGDVVYFDPPYVPLSKTSDFTSYDKDGFGPKEQSKLRDVAKDLVDRRVHVVLSNSSAPAVYDLYADKDYFEIREVEARRNVNSKGDRRGNVKEVIIVGKNT